MQTNTNQQLLNEITDFLADAGMSESYFGKKAVGNSELVSRLKAGGDVMVKTANRVRDFISHERHNRNICARPKRMDA